MERSAKPLQFLVDCNFEIQEGGDIKYASNLFNFLSFFLEWWVQYLYYQVTSLEYFLCVNSARNQRLESGENSLLFSRDGNFEIPEKILNMIQIFSDSMNV